MEKIRDKIGSSDVESGVINLSFIFHETTFELEVGDEWRGSGTWLRSWTFAHAMRTETFYNGSLNRGWLPM